MNAAREAERIGALLDRRSAALARRGGAGPRAESGPTHLVFQVSGERFGLPLAAVAGVLPARPCTPVPGAPPGLHGIVAHDGFVVGVIDPARMLGLGEAEETERAHLVLLRGLPVALALTVGRVVGMAQVADPPPAPEDDRRETGSPSGRALGHEAISGYAPAGVDAGSGETDGFAVLDPQRLLRPFLP